MTVPFLRHAVCAMLLVVAGSAAAQDLKFEFHGFAGGSVYTEDGAFNNGGGQAAWVVTKEPTTDKGVVGGDVRQTRLNFSLTGPNIADLADATPRAFAEIDFFGGNTAGGFGDISIAPRLRVAYAELKIGKTNTVVRAGQDHDLVLGLLLPMTVGHVAFPLSYQAGTIGWRRPGIGVYQTVPAADMKVELAAVVGRSGWNGAAATLNPDGTVKEPSTETIGMASGLPSFEGRVKLVAKTFEVFVAGHFSRADVNGQNASAPKSNIDTTAINAGGKVSYMGATLAGSLYTGKNLGPLAGNLLQWQPMAALAPLDGSGPVNISEVGGWAQLGYAVTPAVTVAVLHGFANPNDEDLVKAALPRSRNQTTSALLRYQSKGYAGGLEYTMYRTSYTNLPDPLKAQQLMLSGMFFF